MSYQREYERRLRIDRGRVEVLARPPAEADITMTGPDETITRIAGGIETPFEAYLQLDLEVKPFVNNSVREVIECIFPRVATI